MKSENMCSPPGAYGYPVARLDVVMNAKNREVYDRHLYAYNTLMDESESYAAN
jgi:hypothetical protein